MADEEGYGSGGYRLMSRSFHASMGTVAEDEEEDGGLYPSLAYAGVEDATLDLLHDGRTSRIDSSLDESSSVAHGSGSSRFRSVGRSRSRPTSEVAGRRSQSQSRWRSSHSSRDAPGSSLPRSLSLSSSRPLQLYHDEPLARSYHTSSRSLSRSSGAAASNLLASSAPGDTSKYTTRGRLRNQASTGVHGHDTGDNAEAQRRGRAARSLPVSPFGDLAMQADASVSREESASGASQQELESEYAWRESKEHFQRHRTSSPPVLVAEVLSATQGLERTSSQALPIKPDATSPNRTEVSLHHVAEPRNKPSDRGTNGGNVETDSFTLYNTFSDRPSTSFSINSRELVRDANDSINGDMFDEEGNVTSGDETQPLFRRRQRGKSSTSARGRLTSIDLLRGLIVVVMAWDHSKDWLASYKGYDGSSPATPTIFDQNHTEFWYGPLELYQGKPEYLFARFISHFCAPGFALLMGTGMVLLSLARRQKSGWSTWHLLWFFNVRGVVLIALGFVVRASSLVVLINPSPQEKVLAGHPYAAAMLVSFFQVMTSLGLQMIFLSFILELLHQIETVLRLERRLLRLGCNWDFLAFRFQPILLFMLGCACMAGNTLIIHHAQHGDPASASPQPTTTAAGFFVRFILIPGPIFTDNVRVAYPVLPWLGISLWGAAMGFEFKSNPRQAHWRALVNGVLLIGGFFLIRFLGGTSLNFRGLPMGEGKQYPWNSFWSVCKYPPSLAYTSFTVGVDLVLLFLLSHLRPQTWVARFLLPYGRSPLAFYVSHFYIITLLSLIVYSAQHRFGVPLQYVVFLYALVILIEFFIVRAYDKFKSSKTPNSLWRLL